MSLFPNIKHFLSGILMPCLFLLSSLSVAQEDGEYRLQVDDTVKIQVLGEDELSMDIVVNETGVFRYPLLGEITLLGKTLVEVQTMVRDGLAGDFLLNPQVNVNVEVSAAVAEAEAAIAEVEGVYVNGEVVRSGLFEFQKGLTISKAIVLAGGFTERAAKNKITVVPNAGDQKPTRVSLDYILKPGDIVNIPRRFF